MDYSISFEKFHLGEERYIFKPISVVRGLYDEKENEFLTESGLLCEDINGGIYNMDYYFGCPTTLDALKERYGDRAEDVLLQIYFSEVNSNYFIGYADETERLRLLAIPVSAIENAVSQVAHAGSNLENPMSPSSEEVDQEDTQEQFTTDSQNVSTVSFSLQALKDMRSLKLKEVRVVLDHFISALQGEEVKEDTEEENRFQPLIEEEKEKKASSKLILNRQKSKAFTLQTLRREVLKTIVGQDDAVHVLTREIMVNRTSANSRNKSHLLITGPTGTGKTEMVATICRLLELPYFEADATAYTKEGYVGKSVYSMLIGLLNAAGGDLAKAQKGILVIDEIDKKLFGSRDDVGGVSVIQSLYKILDRGRIELDIGDKGSSRTIYFQTKDLTVILMGAFEELYEQKLILNKKPLGFQAVKQDGVSPKALMLTKEDLLRGKVPPEFLGRIGEVTSTVPFTEKSLIHLLTKSNISALRIQKEYFMDVFGVDLQCTYGYKQEIARKVLEQKTNARAIKPIVKESLSHALEDFLNGRRGKVLKLTKETVSNPRKYCVK